MSPIYEELDRRETVAMGEALREDMVHWIAQYGFARLGPFLVGVGVSMVEQSSGHPMAVAMLQEIIKQETFEPLERMQ